MRPLVVFIALILFAGCDLFRNSRDDEVRIVESWTAGPDMANARTAFTASVIRDGNVLVAGGLGANGVLASAEIFDQLQERWTTASPMHVARYEATATELDDGRVLVVGGVGEDSNPTTAVEVYDPITGEWAQLPPLAEGRLAHSATKLPDGSVLIVGGTNTFGQSTRSVERFMPDSNSWVAADSLIGARARHGAVLLENGELLVVGGWDERYLRTGERFNHETGEWMDTRVIPTGRMGLTLHRIQGNTILAMGGFYEFAGSHVYSGLVDRYDPERDGWNSLSDLPSQHYHHAVVRFGDGQFFLIGGFGANGFVSRRVVNFIPSPSAPFWRSAVPLITARVGHAAARLPGNRILVAGGRTSPSGVPIASVEIYSE